jgi:PEP-CTERM motif
MMIRRETARRLAGWMGGLSLLAAAAWAVPAHAGVDVNQAWAAQWKQNLQPDGSWAVTGQIDGFGNGDGTTININPSVPAATISGTSTLSFDPTQGKLRSHSKFDVEVQGDQAGWGQLFFGSTNNSRITDQLTVAAGGFGFAKILILISGSSTLEGSIIDAPISYADTRLEGGVRVSAQVTGTDSVTQSARFDGDQDFTFCGLCDGKFDVNGTLVSNTLLEMIVPWDDNVPFDFNMSYVETFTFDVDGVDAFRVTASGENNFGHTVGLFADVYDAQGNLMPGVRVQSASGINFQNLNTGRVTVPEPSSLALVGLAGLALLGRRRRH